MFNDSILGLTFFIIVMIFLFDGKPDNWDKFNQMIDVHYTQMITP